MNQSKASKGSRPLAKRKRVNKVTAEVANSHTNTSHINTYGQWVAEMSKMTRKRKNAAGPSFKQPSL
jgi:hypothetical protein